MRSKRSQHLLNARNKKDDNKRKNAEAEIEAEEREKWREKQESVPEGMMMMSTKFLQNIVNQLSCRHCGQTGKSLIQYQNK